MVIMDPIADMLTRMRNALRAKKTEVQFPSSKLKKEILRVLKEEGYIIDFKETAEGKGKILVVELSVSGEEKISHLEKVSKPGRRIYTGKDEIPKVLNGHGIMVVSTSKGVMTGNQAKKEGLGGELICKLY